MISLKNFIMSPKKLTPVQFFFYKVEKKGILLNFLQSQYCPDTKPDKVTAKIKKKIKLNISDIHKVKYIK